MNLEWIDSEIPMAYISRNVIQKKQKDIKKVKLHFGFFSKEINLCIKDNLTKNTLVLSTDILKDFTIPKNIPYEWLLQKEDLYVGPVIGLLIPSINNLHLYNKYFHDYNNIKGLIFAFTASDIDMREQLIHGYYYNSIDEKNRWEKGTFPMPGAVYRRSYSRLLPNEFIQIMDNKMFNSNSLNKIKLWEWLSKEKIIKNHLPNTKDLKTIDDLNYMIELYESVYIKKAHTRKSIGMFVVYKREEGYHFLDREKNVTVVANQIATDFIKNLVKNNSYIIQQGVPMKYQNRNVDFRVIMQKDKTKNWKCSDILARFGAEGSISTNFVENGYMMKGRNALKKVYKLNDEHAINKEQEVIRICKEACHILDKYGNFADLGFDVIIDQKKHVWIIEINKLHQNNLILAIPNNRRMFRRVVRRPFEYAKAIAGF